MLKSSPTPASEVFCKVLVNTKGLKEPNSAANKYQWWFHSGGKRKLDFNITTTSGLRPFLGLEIQ